MLKKFPEGFMWGGAVSNVQAEGSNLTDGKGWNVYDALEIKKETGQVDIDDTNIASNHYRQFEEDIEYMKQCGYTAYRFSVVWSRIHPNGDDEQPNELGLAYYDRMIDKLLEAGIQPVVSLVHFDMPANLLKKYNGLANRQVVDFFERHVNVVAERFKDKVKYWITYNEINTITGHAELVGGAIKGEQETDASFFNTITCNSQLAHAKALLTIKKYNPDAWVSGMIAYTPVNPRTSKPRDVLAAQIFNNFKSLISFDIMNTGKFPNYYLNFLNNNKLAIALNDTDLNTIKEASKQLDYLAVSYYQTRTIAAPEVSDEAAFINAVIFNTPTVVSEHSKANNWGWAIDPVGYRKALNDIYQRYGKPVFVVENGLALVEEVNENGEVIDDARIQYHKDHLIAMRDAALIDGTELLGYLAWAPFDFLSSHKEMRKRYGFVYIDSQENNFKRIPKKSYYWYQDVIKTHGESL